MSGTVLAAATAAVVALAVSATGVPVSHVSANDGGVWLTNDNPGNGFRGSFGEFDTPVSQLGYTFGDPGSAPQSSYNLNLLQEGTVVIAVDQAQGLLYPVDSRTGLPASSSGVSIPPNAVVGLGGDVAAVLRPATPKAPAELWAAPTGGGPVASIAALDAVKGRVALKLPGGAAMAVDSHGDVFVASRTELVEVPFVAGRVGSPVTFNFARPLGGVALTTVGPTPVVLDTANATLLFPTEKLSEQLPANVGSGLILQQPGPGAASVLIASKESLVSAPLDATKPAVLATVGGGVPAAPVSLDGCAYGAWATVPARVAQDCGSAIHRVSSLPGPTGGASSVVAPIFRVNHNNILLNDSANGSAWILNGQVSQVLSTQDWMRVLVGQNPKTANSSSTSSSSTSALDKKRPTLVNPTLYARPGAESTLHVLDFDRDPGGSILSIESVSPASGPGYSLSISADTQSVILTLAPGASAPVTFSYSVVDGFGLSASGPVRVVPTNANKPPTPPTTTPKVMPVVSGGTVKLQVLGGWRDPQNGALSILSASVPSGLGITNWTSDGLITYDAPSVAKDTPVVLSYQVTDGYSPGVGGKVELTVLGRGDTKAFPPTGVPDAVRVLVGKSTSFTPLANDLFGADPADPAAKLTIAGPVSAPAGLQVATNVALGTLSFDASRAGIYSLTYRDSFGSALSASTQILVQAVVPAGDPQSPVTSPATVMLHGQYAATVNVVSKDFDPSGDLLTVIGVSSPSSLQASVLDGTYLRIQAVVANPASHEIVSYQVTDGVTNPVVGQVDVLWEPAGPPLPPFVAPTYATVQAGDEVDIPVLAAASDPDGESVHLLAGGSPDAVTLDSTGAAASTPGGLGFASISGGYIRYAAPPAALVTTAESVTASFSVESASGQRTTGESLITVLPHTVTDATPVQPPQVDARASAGTTITIPVPTTGVDPSGASLTLIGITSAPSLGQVLSHTTDSITYEAYPFSPSTGAFAGGTDIFGYQMQGPSGKTANGIIRVGVTPPPQPEPPVAVNHYVTASPGSSATTNLLAGDVISPGDQVRVVSLASTNHPVPSGVSLGGAAKSLLTATTPTGPTALSVAFGISDGTASASIAHVVLRSDPGYVTPPVASDYFPPAPATGAKSITVNVLAKDSDPGGAPGDLVVVGSPTAGVTVSGPDLLIPATPYPQAVPYEVKSSKTGAVAVGVVHVLGGDQGPQLVPGSVIHVPEHGSVSVDIASFIKDPGHTIRLTTVGTVLATPAGGLSESVKDNTTVSLSGLGTYAGPGSLIVQVIDASTLSGSGSITATVSIPVLIGTPTPVVRCPSSPLTIVEGGPGVQADIASLCDVWTPDGSPGSTATFTESWAHVAAGVQLGWVAGETGHVIALTAQSSATPGVTGSIVVGVKGGIATASSTLSVEVVAAPLPRVSPANLPSVEAGQTAVADMSQYVTSPLAHPSVYVTSIHQTAGPAAPASSAGATIRISPPPGTHGQLDYSVDISDAGPSRPDRIVTDTVTLQVLGVPSQPANLQATPANGEVALTWSAAASNGAPVTSYVVTMGQTTRQTSQTTYTWTGLTNGQQYSFDVYAVNQVGSGPKSLPVTAVPKSAPSAPSGVTATTAGAPQGEATITWTAANANGQPITSYTVSVAPSPGGAATQQVAGNLTTLTWTGLSDSIGPYVFSVIAHNSVGASPASTPSNSVYAHGVPPSPPAPTAVAQVSTDQVSTTVVVSWPAVANCNDAQPCAGYSVGELHNGVLIATDTTSGVPCGGAGTLCANFGPITNDGSSYAFTVADTNAEGQASPPSVPSVPAIAAVGAPSPIASLTSAPGDKTLTISFIVPASHASAISQVNFTAAGSTGTVTGSWPNPGPTGASASETITGLTNGTTYTVTAVACNEAAKCSSASPPVSGLITDPYGQPNPPTITAVEGSSAVVASATETPITYTWSGGGNNGRPVKSYQICIDATPCSDYNFSSGGSGSPITTQYVCAASPVTHHATATVTDTASQTSTVATTSILTVPACGTPAAPTLTATPNGPSVTWSWSYSGNPLPGLTYNISIPGDPSLTTTSAAGNATVVYQCSQRGSLSATAHMTDSEPANNSGPAANANPTVPPCVATIGQGAQGTSPPVCSVGSTCGQVNVQMSNFMPNTTYTLIFSTNCDYSGAYYYSACTTTQGGAVGYSTSTLTTDSSGNFGPSPSINIVQYFGYNGATLWFNVDSIKGQQSQNQIVWNCYTACKAP